MGSRTDGGRLNHVADGEALDRLVLGSASRAVAAADGLDVAAALLVAAAVVQLASRSYRSSRMILHDPRSRKVAVETTHIFWKNRRNCSQRLDRWEMDNRNDGLKGDSYLFFLFLTILAVSGLNC